MFTFVKENKGISFMVFCILLACAVATACIVHHLTRPYVVYAGSTPVCMVSSQEKALDVVEKVAEEYTPDGDQVQSIQFDKKVSVQKASSDVEESMKMMTEKEAVDYILEQNKTEEPLFTATVKVKTSKIEKSKPTTEYVRNDDMFAGEAKVKKEGESGTQVTTEESTVINGEVAETEKIDTTVVDEGESKVVEKGTMGLPEGEDWETYEGEPVFQNGDELSKFAVRYEGLPYIGGGFDLTRGVDCIGLVCALYMKYGIKLPRSHPGLRRVGYAVKGAYKPGDILCYNKHVAMYIGNGKMIHATSHGGGVRITKARKNPIAVRRVIN